MGNGSAPPTAQPGGAGFSEAERQMGFMRRHSQCTELVSVTERNADMSTVEDITITEAIIDAYYAKLKSCLDGDVLIAGAGPAGMVAARYMAEAGLRVTIVEKKLSPGGGVWGGGMVMNECVIQEAAREILTDAGVRIKERDDGLLVVDAVELASSLCVKALQAGATLLNVLSVEDVCVRDERMTGVVVNQTTVAGVLHVDPIVFRAPLTIDGTGHDAAVVHALLKHGHKIQSPTGDVIGEGAMYAAEGEKFVVERTGMVYPGLLLAGMSVCAVFGGPRMGPIFGGMLLSGRKAADIAIEELGK